MKPELSDPQYKRRTDMRYDVDLDATVQVCLDDRGDTYLKARGKIENVSMLGSKVCIQALSDAHAEILAQEGRTCSLTCYLPGEKEPVLLSGKIAWIEVNAETSRPSARLGVQLKDTVFGQHYRLLRFLDGLRRKDSETARGIHKAASP